MKLPSIKTLKAITDYPKELRKVLELGSVDECLTHMASNSLMFRGTSQWVSACYHHPGLHSLKMEMADELCCTYGVEYVRAGKGKKSPKFEYLNVGDPYTATLLYINGNYRIGCYGDIVERGNYS